MMTNLGLPKTYGLTRDSGSQWICDCIDRFVIGPPKYMYKIQNDKGQVREAYGAVPKTIQEIYSYFAVTATSAE